MARVVIVELDDKVAGDLAPLFHEVHHDAPDGDPRSRSGSPMAVRPQRRPLQPARMTDRASGPPSSPIQVSRGGAAYHRFSRLPAVPWFAEGGALSPAPRNPGDIQPERAQALCKTRSARRTVRLRGLTPVTSRLYGSLRGLASRSDAVGLQQRPSPPRWTIGSAPGAIVARQ